VKKKQAPSPGLKLSFASQLANKTKSGTKPTTLSPEDMTYQKAAHLKT